MTNKKASKGKEVAFTNIKEYLESLKRKKVFDEELRIIIGEEEGSFVFDGYTVEYKDSSLSYDDGCEMCQWIVQITEPGGDSAFWQVLGSNSSYDGMDFTDYWYDFRKVTYSEKVVIVWE